MKQLEGMFLRIPMSGDNPWILDKSHVRIAFRRWVSLSASLGGGGGVGGGGRERRMWVVVVKGGETMKDNKVLLKCFFQFSQCLKVFLSN